MPHTTKIVHYVQVNDEQHAICIACCNLEGQILECARDAERDQQCPNCEVNPIAVACEKCGHKTHPGCPMCRGIGHRHEKDTRSWHTMGPLVLNDPEKMQESIDGAHQRIRDTHEAALQAEATLKAMVGKVVEHP